MITDAIATQPAMEALSARVGATLGLGSSSEAGIITGKVIGKLALLGALSSAAVLFYARKVTKTNRRRRPRVTPNV